jgi:hypothetical protein
MRSCFFRFLVSSEVCRKEKDTRGNGGSLVSTFFTHIVNITQYDCVYTCCTKKMDKLFLLHFSSCGSSWDQLGVVAS